MNRPIPTFLQPGLVKTKEMYDSFNFTSGTKKAKPTISFLYIATQLKSGYWRLSVTKMKININENYTHY